MRTQECVQSAAAAEPLAAWVGGKKLLARSIIERIDSIPHRCYAEPFVGMGGVFLRRSRRPKNEVINDRNGEIVNLFRITREHPDELARQFRWCLASREEFRRLLSVSPETLTDIQRAARFAYLQRLSFGGKPAHDVSPGQMGSNTHHPATLRVERMRRLIAAAHTRLQGVHVECLDWEVFLRRFDRPWTLFYIDPPYWGHENDYGKGIFSRSDFGRMAELLSNIQGRFLLSLNDRPEVNELFSEFRIEVVNTRYSANIRSSRRVNELLISNTRLACG